MFIQKIKNYYYLVERYKEGDKVKTDRLISFCKHKPTFYEPKIVHGNAVEELKKFGIGSIQLVVTSPPYFQLKEAPLWNNYKEYHEMLNEVWKGCYNALDNGCRLCINIGDEPTSPNDYGRHKIIPIHADIISGCEKVGFDYMGSIIWNRQSCSQGSISGSFPYPREFLVSYEHEYIMLFKKPGRGKKPNEDIKKASKIRKSDWTNRGLWRFTGERKLFHSSAFPEELPKRLIRMFSFVGDTILDPFMGSGTTLVMAHQLARKSIGVELNERYIQIAKERVARNLVRVVNG